MHNSSMKAVIWMGRSKEDLVDFPEDCRRESGYQLERVQRGEEPKDWKPMATVGAGVREIRIHESSGAFRVIYLATRPEGVYVLHCFQKKGQRTSHIDLTLATSRFKAIPSNARK
jgi:phage-related protein